MAPSPELEAALEEASVAVDEVREASTAAQEGGKSNADKLTIEALCAELEETRLKLAETDERFLRLQAEFENFRKRGVREREEAHRYGHQNLVKDLLATVDNLERAIDHAAGGDEEGLEGVVQGVELVHRDLLSALGKYGVSSIEALAEPFDPNVHEAVGQVPSEDSPPNTVVQVLEKGVLRSRSPDSTGQGDGLGGDPPARGRSRRRGRRELGARSWKPRSFSQEDHGEWEE